jgi:hypothetical protein
MGYRCLDGRASAAGLKGELVRVGRLLALLAHRIAEMEPERERRGRKAGEAQRA